MGNLLDAVSGRTIIVRSQENGRSTEPEENVSFEEGFQNEKQLLETRNPPMAKLAQIHWLRTRGILEVLAKLEKNHPDAYLRAVCPAGLYLRSRIARACDLALAGEAAPSETLIRCQTRVAELLEASANTAEVGRSYRLLGHLWESRARTMEDTNAALNAFTGDCLKIWLQRYNSNQNYFRHCGWEPLSAQGQIFRNLARACHQNGRLEELLLLAGHLGLSNNTAPVARILWDYIDKVHDPEALSAKMLRKRAQAMLHLQLPQKGLAFFRRAAAKAKDRKFKADCLRMAVYTAALLMKNEQKAKQIAVELHQIAPHGTAAKKAKEYLKRAGFKDTTNKQ